MRLFSKSSSTYPPLNQEEVWRRITLLTHNWFFVCVEAGVGVLIRCLCCTHTEELNEVPCRLGSERRPVSPKGTDNVSKLVCEAWRWKSSSRSLVWITWAPLLPIYWFSKRRKWVLGIRIQTISSCKSFHRCLVHRHSGLLRLWQGTSSAICSQRGIFYNSQNGNKLHPLMTGAEIGLSKEDSF